LAKLRLLPFILCFFLFIFLTGCWDQINIEERGFVIGTAVDKADNHSDESQKLALTNQIVSPAGLGTPTEGGGDEPPYINLTTSGESIFAINRKMLKETSRPPFYEQLRLLVISEEVALDGDLFASMLDLFIRDQEMRRIIKVIIAEDKAKDVLEVDPKPEKLPVVHVDMTTENAFKSMDMIQPVILGRLHSYLLNDNSYVLPRISVHDKDVDYTGVVVFNGLSNQMVGSLDASETKGMNLIKGNMNGGYIKFEVDNHNMNFEIERTNSKMTLVSEDPKNMDIQINIKVEGRLAEMYGSKTLLDSSYLAKMESKIADKVERLANKTIEKAQNDLKLDVLDIDKVLKQRHYHIWKKINKNWEYNENIFSKSNIKVSANVQVREVGATDRAKDKNSD